MRRDELHELHYITLIDNVPSILTKGILSHYIDPAVLDLDGAIVTDRNAASNARFSPGKTGLSLIDREQVFAEYWTHPSDELATDNHKKIKCAEVLVPSRIPPNYIVGAYVSCVQNVGRLGEVAPRLPVTMDAHLFFQEQRPWFIH